MTKILQVSKIALIAFALFTVTLTAYFAITTNSVMAYGDSGCGSCGGGGDVSGGGGSNGGGGGGSSTPAPTCDISTNISVVNTGDQYTISWRGTPATRATFKVNDYPVSAVGQKTYTFTAANYSRFVFTGQTAGGTCVDEVRVNRRVVEAPRCESFTATPGTLPIGGGSVALTWDTTNATNATIDGQAVAGDGTMNVNVTANKTFTLNLSNSVGSASCSASVTVPTPVFAPVCVLNASQNTIVAGGSTRLSWTSQNTSGPASIDKLVGNVDPRNVNGFREVQPTVTTTYTMTVQNSANVSAICTRTITVTPVAVPLPSCVINATPATIVSGNSSTLKWTTTNAVSASLNQTIGSVQTGTDKTRSVSPTATKNYILTVTNSAGITANCSAQVTVTSAPVPLPSCVINATPATIVSGRISTLKWTTTNAVTASLSQTIGAVEIGTDKTRSVSPTTNTTYVMTVTNSMGATAVCNASITVVPPAPRAPRCDNFDATPVTINRGGSTLLSWNTTNANSASINNAIGGVTVDGSEEVSPLQTTDYLLSLVGTNNQTASCIRRVTVIQPTIFSCANNVNFYASRSSIDEGESTSIVWTTNGVSSLSISNLSSNALSGNETVSPRSNTEYVMNISNGSQSATCRVNVDVDEDNGSSGSSPTPRCELKISDGSIVAGERVTLTWETSYATELSLKDSSGKVLIDTDDMSSSDKQDLYDGEITLRPEIDTTYTLVTERGSRDRTCTVSVDVSGGITVLQTRDQQPLVTGIALTQVPYTGFEAGTFMTVVFYTLLALFALYLAYIFGVRPRVAGNLAAVLPTHSPYTPAVAAFAAPVKATPNFHAPRTESFSASTAMVGYATAVATEVTGIEARAHAAGVLLSADALAQIAAITDADNINEVSTTLFTLAKESFPSEDGYVTLTNERLTQLLS